MKLPRFRLGTLLKVVVVVNLAAAMIWGNLRWRAFRAGDELSSQEIRLILHTYFWHRAHFRGWPFTYRVQMIEGEQNVMSLFPLRLESVDPAAWTNNLFICVSILLGAVLVMQVGPRLLRRQPRVEPDPQTAHTEWD